MHVLSSEIPLQSALPMMACTVIRLYLNIVKTGSAVNHHQTSPSVVRNQVGNVQLLWPLFTTNPFPRLSGRGWALKQGWTGSLQSSQISPVKSVRHSQICFLHLLKKKKKLKKKYELKLSVHSEYIPFQKRLRATPLESRSSLKQEAQQSTKQNSRICSTLYNSAAAKAGCYRRTELIQNAKNLPQLAKSWLRAEGSETKAWLLISQEQRVPPA